METFALAKIALSDFGTTLVVVVVQELLIWRVNQSRYWVVLLRLTLLFWGLGASPMLSSIKLKWGHGIVYCDCRPKVGPEFVALLIGVQFSAVTSF